MKFYATLSRKSRDVESLKIASQNIVQGVTANSPLPDQRALIYSVIESLPKQEPVSKTILDLLPLLILKENNENSMILLLTCYASHLIAITDGNVDSYIAYLVKGLTDPKSMVKKACLHALLKFVKDTSTSSLSKMDVTKIFQALLKIALDMQSMGVSIIDPKKETYSIDECISVIDCILTLTEFDGSLKISQLFDEILNPGFSLSLVFSERFFTKLNTEDGHMSFARLLLKLITFDSLFDTSKQKLDFLADLGMFVLLNGKTVALQYFLNKMAELTASDSKFITKLTSIIRIGWGRTLAAQNSESESIWNCDPPRSSKELGQKLTRSMYSILPIDIEDKMIIERALVDLFIICCHPTIAQTVGTDFWVRLAFRSGISPDFISQYQHVFSTWLSLDSADYTFGGLNVEFPDGFRKATLAALKLCSQIVPSLIIPRSVEWSLGIIRNEEYTDVSPMEVAVWKTPVGQLYNNPLEKKEIIHKKGLTKDQKWELELKLELEAKKAKTNSAKLSKADQELYEAQMLREQTIRARIDALHFQLISALDVLDNVFDAVIADSTGDCKHVAWPLVSDLTDAILDNLISRECFVFKNGNSVEPCGVLAGPRAFALYENYAKIALEGASTEIDIQSIIYSILFTGGMDLDNENIPAKFAAKSMHCIYY